jgi:exodeoxyribonuclease V alpha subunit
MTKPALLEDLPGISGADRALASMLDELCAAKQRLTSTFLLLSRMTGRQHHGLDIGLVAGKTLAEAWSLWMESEALPETIANTVAVPHDIREQLELAPHVVGDGRQRCPVIWDRKNDVLYLRKYYDFECAVAEEIQHRLTGHGQSVTFQQDWVDGIQRLFPSRSNPAAEPDWQKVAAISALRHRFCIINGGPGTGKTTTVAKILALLVEQNPELTIDLLAPTGKAADRLVQSIEKAFVDSERHFPGCDKQHLDKVPRSAQTLHRFLDYRPGAGFRKNRDNPCGSDVVLVDESSMVSLELFAHLFRALKAETRVILLGDPNQLSSVDVGQVLGDLSSQVESDEVSPEFANTLNTHFAIELPQRGGLHPLFDATTTLKVSYRFHEESGIGQLASAALNQECQAAKVAFEAFPNELTSIAPLEVQGFETQLMDLAKPGLEAYRQAVFAQDPAEMLKRVADFQVLCARNGGAFGVDRINEIVAQKLWKRPEQLDRDGKVLMIVQNDKKLGLYNGDVGVIYDDKAWFPGVGEPRCFPISALPPRRSADAMTIHKSQGSEYDEVLLVLESYESPLLNRELIYTGITRAKAKLTLWHDWEVTSQALGRRMKRTACLGRRLVGEV